MSQGIEPYGPVDPARQAYQAGKELAQRLGSVADAPFEHPFFQQGQTKKVQQNKRTMHVINDHEYILTEETILTEVFSFGNDIFKQWR